VRCLKLLADPTPACSPGSRSYWPGIPGGSAASEGKTLTQRTFCVSSFLLRSTLVVVRKRRVLSPPSRTAIAASCDQSATVRCRQRPGVTNSLPESPSLDFLAPRPQILGSAGTATVLLPHHGNLPRSTGHARVHPTVASQTEHARRVMSVVAPFCVGATAFNHRNCVKSVSPSTSTLWPDTHHSFERVGSSG
jgi:hypothetical protein